VTRAEIPIRAVIFDFGGVLAAEGFREGLEAIALRHGLDPAEVFTMASDVIYETGYITGRGTEADYWDVLRRKTGITGEDSDLTGEILRRFVLRPRMLAAVRALRADGFLTAILSDQTDWLERLDARDRFFLEFDQVFNSYRLGKGKRDATIFDDTVHALGVAPGEALFVDDNSGHVERAASRGLRAVLFRNQDRFLSGLGPLTGGKIVFR
jgi:putative hydrolase of the HAD superfamily